MNITRILLNLFINLHRSALYRAADASQKREDQAFAQVLKQEAVVEYERNRLSNMDDAAYDIQDEEIATRMSLSRELAELPPVRP